MIFCTIYLGPFVWYLPLSLQPPAVFVGSHSVAANATAIRVLLNILEEPHAQNLPCEVAHACSTPPAGVIGSGLSRCGRKVPRRQIMRLGEPLQRTTLERRQ